MHSSDASKILYQIKYKTSPNSSLCLWIVNTKVVYTPCTFLWLSLKISSLVNDSFCLISNQSCCFGTQETITVLSLWESLEEAFLWSVHWRWWFCNKLYHVRAQTSLFPEFKNNLSIFNITLPHNILFPLATSEQEEESKHPFGCVTSICGFLLSYVREDKDKWWGKNRSKLLCWMALH